MNLRKRLVKLTVVVVVVANFHQRLVSEALDRVRGFQPRRVLDLLSLRRATLFAVGSAVAMSVVFLLFSERLPTAFARILQPWPFVAYHALHLHLHLNTAYFITRLWYIKPGSVK